ncbi:type II/IV secretion system protein [Candidatus Uhrbacteria bacterium]|nr:type II/IV secretion system protein [Candidatus Uhrbacteria bacterium]
MPDEIEQNIEADEVVNGKVEAAIAANAQAPVKVITKEAIASMIEQAGQVGRSHDAAINIFNGIMAYAQSSRASDVHLEPIENGSVVRIRVDGILHDMFKVSKELHVQMIAVLKVLTRMRTDEHRAPQDGRYEFKIGAGSVDVRVSIISVTDGEKAVLRLLSDASHDLSLEDLGLFDTDLQRVQRAIERPWGMILATGPTGSGKTTTVYAILEVLNQREINISTIEDPVEFDIEGVNQSQVDSSAKLTFASGLRSIVRQDPDIIMVGEIRDEETASIAVNAALTGHKLLSTIHTNNAASTIVRLIDMKVEPFLISSTLICAVAQRLVRRVCDDCHKVKSWTKEEASKVLSPNSVIEMFGDKESVAVPEVVGCVSCGETGYRGRVGIYEVLENTKAIQKLIVSGADSDTIQEQALKEGMTTIAQDGIRKVRDQITTIEELIRVMRE